MNNNFQIVLTTTAICTALLSSAAMACLDDEQESREIHSFVFSPDGESQEFSTSKSIEIRDVNGELTVVIDGKEVPSDRIKREGGRIKIFDEDGNELPMLGVTIDAGKAGKGMFFGLRDMLGKGHDADTMMQWFGGEMKPPKVMMGIHLSQPSKALEYHLGLDAGTTTLIADVVDGLGAAEAGIAKYDIVVAINGKKPADPESIRQALADKEPGDEITLSVIHQGKKRKANVKLNEYDNTQFGTFRLYEIGENFPFGPQGNFEFKIDVDGDLEQLKEIFIDPQKGNFFRQRFGDRDFNFEFNKELLEKLGNDFGEDLKLKLHMNLTDEDKIQESRSDAIRKQIERLQKQMDDLVEKAKTLEDDDSDT